MTDPFDAVRSLASVLPLTAQSDAQGHLRIGGCDVAALAAEYGTPLYLFDEATIRDICRQYRREFGDRLPGVRVLYAAKAYLSPALAAILAEEGLGLDVVSGGELYVARAAGFPADRLAFHGNNKSVEELDEALDARVGRVMVDNFHEIALLDDLARARGLTQRVLLRVSPGIDAHTHAKTTTGLLDSKFGFPLQSGAADEAVRRTLAAPGLELTGFHMHLGSPIYDVEPFVRGIEVMAGFALRMSDAFGFVWREFSPGGGFAAAYTPDRPAPPIATYAEAIARALHAACATHELPLPEAHIEPGRSIVARAGVAVYAVGARKEIPNLRTYVAVDGGMADNIRPAMYGSHYTALVANRTQAPAAETVTIAGKFCESGDLLIQDIPLPRLESGDLLAMPAAGAYHLAMESNYNLALRPPVLFVREGVARLARRRQAYADLLAAEIVPDGAGRRS